MCIYICLGIWEIDKISKENRSKLFFRAEFFTWKFLQALWSLGFWDITSEFKIFKKIKWVTFLGFFTTEFFTWNYKWMSKFWNKIGHSSRLYSLQQNSLNENFFQKSINILHVLYEKRQDFLNFRIQNFIYWIRERYHP